MDMDGMRELLTVSERQALEFFFLGLKDFSESDVDHHELLYNASVLAHYTQVSTQANDGLPAPASLCDVFDRFVWGDGLNHGSAMMEVAGTQCLLLTGFFEDHMRRRHSIRWYANLGAGYFNRAANQEPSPRKAQLLYTMAQRFEPWRQRHARLGRELRDLRYLLRPPSSQS